MSKLTVLGLSSHATRPIGHISGGRPPEVSPGPPATPPRPTTRHPERRRCLTLAAAAVAVHAAFGVEPATAQVMPITDWLTVDDASASEGDSMTFTVTLHASGFAEGFTVTPSFTDGTATEGTDYTENTAGIEFEGLLNEKHTFTVATTEDEAVEADETFTVALTVTVDGTVREIDTGTGTILNDDSAPALTIADASAAEGDSMTFTVTLDKAVSGQFYVDPSFADGTATKGTDYTEYTEELDFAGTAGETRSFTVATTEDTDVETDETFTVSLRAYGISEPPTATDTATGTITDDDAPALTIADASASEGEGITFTVTLDNAVSGGLTVTPSFSDGTATKGTDYTENTAGISFTGTANETQTFTVATTEDTDEESDETFTVSLSVSGTSVTVTATDTATGTITDDDAVPPGTPVITNPGNKSYEQGETINAFDITVSDEASDTMTVTVTGLPSGLSYTGGQVQGTVAASATAQDYTVTIRAVDEGGLSATATFTITVTAAAPALTIADASAAEGDAITFTVTLDAAVSGGLTVTPSFTDGTAEKGVDYTANTAGIGFSGNAGESKSFTVTTTEDSDEESDETFTVRLSVSGTSVTVTATDTATGTINDDDTVPAGTPVITNPGNKTYEQGETITAFDITVSDEASDTMTVTVTGLPSGLSYTSGQVQGTVAASATAQDYTATIRAVDEGGLSATATFTITVTVPAPVTAAEVTVADARADEGDSMTFTVTLDKAVTGGLTVTPSFTDGTATKGADYTENRRGLGFAGNAGETRSFTVATTEDTDIETDETFTVSLAVSGTSATVTATDTATGTITNDDRRETSRVAAAVTVADATADEGDSMTFTVTLDAAVSGGLTVTPSFTDGTANKGADYTENTAALRFTGTAGENRSFTVATTEDTDIETDETFTVSLAVSGTSATVTATDTATGTITNDDRRETSRVAAAVTVADATADEGDSMTFTVTLDAAVSGGLTVTPSFTDGTANKGADYTENTAALRFTGTAGENRSFTVATTEDSDVETDETFTVSLAVSGTSATVTATDTATGTITNDDRRETSRIAAAVTVADARAVEGESMTFTVTLDWAVSGGLTVTPSFTDGTATKGMDYTGNSAALTFAGTAGETQTFTVATTDDGAVEPDETFTVSLNVSGTSAPVTHTDTATGTIDDDDDAPAVDLSLTPSSVSEGGGSTPVTVTASFSTDRTFAEDRTVTVSVGGGTATSAADYAAVSSFDITIAGGASRGAGTFRLRPLQDTAVEGRETIEVSGGAGNLTVSGSVLTLRDDDDAPAVNLTASPSSASEGDGSTPVTVTASFSTDRTFTEDRTVTVSVGGGTAASGTDYAAVSDFDVTIAGGAGRGTGTFTLTPIGDGVVEGDETIDVAGGAGGLTVNGTALTLTDDDDAPAVNLTASPSSVTEGDGSTPVTVTASFSTDRTFADDRTVTVSVGGGTATSGTDYAAVSDFDITIAGGAGSGTGTFTLTPIDDGVVEGDETIDVAGGAGDLTVTGTALTLTDSTPRLHVSTARAVEGETMVFTVSLQSPSPRAVTVQYATVDGTATAGTDYTSTSGQLVFSADETERQVSVPIMDDAEVEDNETFALAVHLADAVGSSATATGTVLENDVLTFSVTAPDVQEADGTATFTGSLSSASPYRIVVPYGTSDGTATAGADYVETTGELVFEPGETEKAVVVQVMDDDLVEGTETLLLSMTVVPVGSRAFGSSAAEAPPLRLTGSGATDQASPTSLQVTGTIRDDELAQARAAGTSPTLHLLARSIASEAVAAIGERFAATGGGDTPRAGLGAVPAPSGQGGAAAGVAVAYPAASVSGAAGAGASAGPGQGAMTLHRPSDQPFADLGWLDNAYFSTPVGEAGESGGWQVWGRAGTVRSRLQSRTGEQARGDVFSTHVGMDTRLGGSALLGASVSHTVGLLGYTAPSSLAAGASPGEGDGSVTSVQPYAHWAPRNGLTLWGMGGGGRGSLTLADSAGTVETPLAFRLFAGGARQALTDGLALKADAFHATLRSAERADLAAATGTAIRGRMLAEGQTDWSLSDSSSLNPRLEAGLRWDGGTDVEGMGAEMGAGVAFVNRRLNLGLETQGRYLVAHQADGFEEWGAGLSVRVGPGIDRPGPWLALAPEWGTPDSRVNALWDPGAAPELHRGAGGAPGAGPDRLAASAGYRVGDAGGVAIEALHETRPGDDGGVAVRVTGNLSWGGADGGPRAGGGAPDAEREAPVRRGAVAVAAFRNVSGAPADQWIGAGVTETLTSALGRLDALSVVGDGEAGEAPPAWRVAGEYRRWGDRVRIDARVVDMRTGAVAARAREEGATAELFDLLGRMTVDLAGELESLSAGGGAGGREPASPELPGRRRDVRGSEGGGAAAATRWALAGGRDAGIAPAQPSTAVRLDTVDEAGPSAPRSSGRRPAGSRDAGTVQAGPSTPGRLDEARPSAPRSSGRRPAASPDTGMAQARPSTPGRLDEARPAAPARLDTVTIDPFRNVLQAPADDWLGVGVTETLTIALQQLDGVEVVGNTGGAGPEAAWLVTGEYRRRGGRLQMDARVVDTRTGAVAARSSVEGAAVDFFDMQDRITADVAAALGNLSTGGEPGRRESEPRAARVQADASRSPREILSLRLPPGLQAGPGFRGALPARLDGDRATTLR